jgi:uncharacterized protein YcaQ
MPVTRQALKAHALASSLFKPTTLRQAVERLGFVQADPIRAPARAQDLILRHRVKGYRAGDLEKHYPRLGLEEDFVYAYGFVPPSTWRLLHPRLGTDLSAAEERVLALVSAQTCLHPRELEAHLGREREINAWGGYSKATTRILQALHYRGLLRVSGRENGIRLYAVTPQRQEEGEPAERLRKLVLLIARILAPVPERSLQETIRHLAHTAPGLPGRALIISKLVNSGELASAEVEGLRYLWPTGKLMRTPPEEAVRFLAPFDPLVWDRRRFEHLWGWAYRFEAYTPAAKRKLGYYAMPLLWRDEVIGWANVSNKSGAIAIKTGFISAEPKEKEFRRALETEVERFHLFLQQKSR